MKIIGFSGPPHSGKDSIADAIVAKLMTDRLNYHTAKMSLAAPMRRVGMTLLGFDPGDDTSYARLKEEAQQLFSIIGASAPYMSGRVRDNLRQFMIAFSEDFIKPRYGHDFWARLLHTEACALGLEDAVILVPDFGFHSEVKYFEDVLGWQNLLVVRLARAGCDFAKDSRDYVAGSQTYVLNNDGTIAEAAELVIDAATHQYSWSL